MVNGNLNIQLVFIEFIDGEHPPVGVQPCSTQHTWIGDLDVTPQLPQRILPVCIIREQNTRLSRLPRILRYLVNKLPSIYFTIIFTIKVQTYMAVIIIAVPELIIKHHRNVKVLQLMGCQLVVNELQ